MSCYSSCCYMEPRFRCAGTKLDTSNVRRTVLRLGRLSIYIPLISCFTPQITPMATRLPMPALTAFVACRSARCIPLNIPHRSPITLRTIFCAPSETVYHTRFHTQFCSLQSSISRHIFSFFRFRSGFSGLAWVETCIIRKRRQVLRLYTG
ncbi:hypothetical protein BDM02DRAFT_604779 [Thelephora ganbajun]|uniref:Uncharacterized protein n=1 Tax=Thelephora ganbajun TaxID=370292 RepID=A0ACB6Z7Z9_THEGA|nr:hypothetical protein BDM02DRAFT_604779 [Thelephora ganbajun]